MSIKRNGVNITIHTKPSKEGYKYFFLSFTVNAILDGVAIVTPSSNTFRLFSIALMDEQIVFLM